MEEGIKNRIILILSILSVIFFLGAVSSCNNARQLKSGRDKEMANRLDVEEKMAKSFQEKAAIEEKINSLSRELEKEKTDHVVTKKALEQEQLASRALKEELEGVTKLKEQFEKDLKEALVAAGQGKSKR